MGEGTVDGPAVQGYTREAIDDFLAAADVERARLREVIAEAESRTQRARAALGVHRVMTAMLLEAQADVAERRRLAEEEAAAILRAADDEAQSVLREAYAEPDGTLDLVRAEKIDEGPVYGGSAATFHTI